MTLQISPQDWQLLSAYLDHQLSPREQEHLEKRLRSTPELQNALEGLRQTRAVLRAVPRRKVPRNFTLKPEDVAALAPRRLPRLFPVLSFSSALAAVLMVLALFVRLPAPSAALTQSAAAPMAAAAPEMASQAAEDSSNLNSAPIINWNIVGGLGGGGGGDGSDMVLTLPPDAGAAIAKTAPQATEEPATLLAAPTQEAGAMQPTPTAVAPLPTRGAFENQQVTVFPEPTPQPPAVAAEPAGTFSGNPILGVQPTAESANTEPLPVEPAQPREMQATSSPAPWFIPAGLGLLAALTGLWALLLYRKSRP